MTCGSVKFLIPAVSGVRFGVLRQLPLVSGVQSTPANRLVVSMAPPTFGE